MSRSSSDRQPPRHRRFDPDDRDDQHRALTVAAEAAGVTDVAVALIEHDEWNIDSGVWDLDSLCGCACPDGLCIHLDEPVRGDGWQAVTT